MSKVYKDFIPPESGRVYSITAVGDGTSRIEDVTQYVQEGDTWGAADANAMQAQIDEKVSISDLPKAFPLEVLRVAPLDVQVLGAEHLNKYLIVSNENPCVIQVPGSLGSIGDEVYITGTADALLGIQPYGLDMATIRSAGGKTTTQTAYTLLVLKKIGEAEWILQGGLG